MIPVDHQCKNMSSNATEFPFALSQLLICTQYLIPIKQNYIMALSDTSFVPKENVPRNFGRQMVYFDLKLALDMSYSKNSYESMVSKSAFEPVGISFVQMLQILADITCTALLVSILQSKFKSFTKKAIPQVGNFKVLSYQGPNGWIINNTTLYNRNLKPTDN
jgi:hypothetical protein